MTVIYNDHRAETVIDVVERDKENKASKYDFELKEEDFGDKKIRALWRETTLIITTSNQFVKSYRGEFDQEKQAGENEKRLYWKIYLTEILADKITEKRIEQDSKLTPDVFSDILHGDSEEAVVAHMQYITTKIRTDILHQLHQQLNVTKARLVDG